MLFSAVSSSHGYLEMKKTIARTMKIPKSQLQAEGKHHSLYAVQRRLFNMDINANVPPLI